MFEGAAGEQEQEPPGSTPDKEAKGTSRKTAQEKRVWHLQSLRAFDKEKCRSRSDLESTKGGVGRRVLVIIDGLGVLIQL